MAASNPSVSVFHFTSRISSAKIRKYKLATERGMNAGGSSSPLASTTELAQRAPSSQAANGNSTLMEPPTKRPKLKLNVRPPAASTDTDTIAVSRPKRESALKIRYSENMVIDPEDEPPPTQRSKAALAASSNMSSFPVVKPREKVPSPPAAPPPEAPKPKQRDYSRDFMSYYVTGGDEEDDEQQEEVGPQPEPKKPDPPLLAQKPAPSKVPNLPSLEKSRKQSHRQPFMQTPAYPDPRLQPPRPPPPPQPTVQLIDSSARPARPKEPETVAELVAKVEKLIGTLTVFSGKNPNPQSPREVPPNAPQIDDSAVKGDVDNLLALFDDDDDDEHTDTERAKPSPRPEAQSLKSGETDLPLRYGVCFIQNALRSWAQNRLTGQYTQAYMEYHQHAYAAGKREVDRSRKSGDGSRGSDSPPPLNAVYDFALTPEGAAVNAFQDIMDAGLIQVNAILPVELSRSLRRLYTQIDALINTDGTAEVPWVCMSYGAQIAAQKSRVEAWQVAHAKAQEELARHQHQAQLHMMSQMGTKQQQRGRMMHDQLQQQHAIDLERKRSRQHAAQQPHLTEYLTNPLRLDGQIESPDTHNPLRASPASANFPSAPPLGMQNNTSGFSNMPTAPRPDSSATDSKSSQLDKIKLNLPNYLPRSGQSMKFSFAPTSELALKTFGAQAFPVNHRNGPMLPNRGPMSANPYYQHNAPVLQQQHQSQSGDGGVRISSQAQEPRTNGSGFTPINGNAAGAQQVNGGAAQPEAMVVD